MTLTEWIFSKLPTIDKDDPYYRDIIEQANQMEMQRIMQSYNDGKLAVIKPRLLWSPGINYGLKQYNRGNYLPESERGQICPQERQRRYRVI